MSSQIRTALHVAIAALLVAAFAATALSPPCSAADKEKSPRLFELRTYTTHPGKLEALHARFRDHTNRIFKKHGMQLIGYWTPADGAQAENTLIYILGYSNMEARKKAWDGFRNDPDWKKAFKESRADGPIVKKVDSRFLKPTDYSPIK